MANKYQKKKDLRLRTDEWGRTQLKEREIKKWLQLILNCTNPRKIFKFKLG